MYTTFCELFLHICEWRRFKVVNTIIYRITVEHFSQIIRRELRLGLSVRDFCPIIIQ